MEYVGRVAQRFSFVSPFLKQGEVEQVTLEDPAGTWLPWHLDQQVSCSPVAGQSTWTGCTGAWRHPDVYWSLLSDHFMCRVCSFTMLKWRTSGAAGCSPAACRAGVLKGSRTMLSHATVTLPAHSFCWLQGQCWWMPNGGGNTATVICCTHTP